MLHSEMLARTIHEDRLREIERATRQHRLLAPDFDPGSFRRAAVVPSGPAARPARGGSASGQPA